MFKKVLPLCILVLAMALFGCSVQKKPAPTQPQQKPMPQESVIGFSQIDVQQAPDTVQKILSKMSKREMVAWANIGNENYIIVNPEPDDVITVEKVIRRVPTQNFLWLDVLLSESDSPKKQRQATPVIYKLDKANQNINGVGFEIIDDDDDDDEDKDKNRSALNEKQNTQKETTTPQSTTKTPAAPVNPIPERKPTPPEVMPETKKPQQEQQEQKTPQERQLEQLENQQQTKEQEIKTLP